MVLEDLELTREERECCTDLIKKIGYLSDTPWMHASARLENEYDSDIVTVIRYLLWLYSKTIGNLSILFTFVIAEREEIAADLRPTVSAVSEDNRKLAVSRAARMSTAVSRVMRAGEMIPNTLESVEAILRLVTPDPNSITVTLGGPWQAQHPDGKRDHLIEGTSWEDVTMSLHPQHLRLFKNARREYQRQRAMPQEPSDPIPPD